MPTFAIESNGLLEKTAVYYNGEQLGGVREIFLNIDEEGTFDAIIQYVGKRGEVLSKQIFTDYLDDVRIVPPAFSEEEARNLRMLTVESNGDLDSTLILVNDEPLEGVVSLYVHIKSGGVQNKSGLRALFGKDTIPDRDEFRAEITFRNEDDSLETEGIFT